MSDFLTSLQKIPNFLGHEHWGSLAAFSTASGFRADWVQGAMPQRSVSFADILLDPYFRMWADPHGKNIDALVRGEVYNRALESPVEILNALEPVIHPQRLTGVYQCIRLGLLAAHGLDLEEKDPQKIEAAQNQLTASYDRYFDWLPDAMGVGGFSTLVRPVEPEYYFEQETEAFALAEQRLTRTLLRIDGLVGMVTTPSDRGAQLASRLGVEPPADSRSWRLFLDALFSTIREKGAVGIKQLQAYRRCLDFALPDGFQPVFSGAQQSPDHLLENWVIQECCQRAHALGWPHQLHVGTHNLPDSNPLPIKCIAEAYPRQTLVLLHCWPYLDACAFLAKSCENIHLDACWMAILSPAFLRRALQDWLQFVPTSRMHLSHDATSVEMALGSAILNRRILADCLSENLIGEPSEQARIEAAHALLHENGERLYRKNDAN